MTPTNGINNIPRVSSAPKPIFAASNPVNAGGVSNTAQDNALSTSLSTGNTGVPFNPMLGLFNAGGASNPANQQLASLPSLMMGVVNPVNDISFDTSRFEGLNMGMPMDNIFSIGMPPMIDFSQFSNNNNFGQFYNSDTGIYDFKASTIAKFSGVSRGSSKHGHLSQECMNMAAQMGHEMNFKGGDLEWVMGRESGCNPQARNPNGGAIGLIQWMPSTLRTLSERLGRTITSEQVGNMTAEQQMPLVAEYLKMAKQKAGFPADHMLTRGELYALVFMPAKANSQSGVLCSEGSAAYAANRGLDPKRTGEITVEGLGNLA